MRGLVWPVLLIAGGLVLLAANLGYVPPIDARRAILLGWPLILILVGIDLALARRYPLPALALQVAAVALVATTLVTRADVQLARGTGESRGTVAREAKNADGGVTPATTLSLRITVGGTRLTVSGGAPDLVEAVADQPVLRVTSSRRGGAVDARVTQEHDTFVGSPSTVDVRIASDVPTDLRLDSGAGEFTLDLRDVRITGLRIATGASTLHLILPRPVGELPVRIDGGAMSLDIEVPEGVEARVATQGALVSISGRTETPGYAAARDRVTVSVSGGAASVNVR